MVCRSGTLTPSGGFQGDWTDSTAKEVWLGALHCTPATGTLTSRDTYAGQLATPISLNRYTYAHGNPLNMIDPDGHAPDPMWFDDRTEYLSAVLYTIEDYKLQEFARVATGLKKMGYSPEQVVYLVKLHFKTVVGPQAVAMLAAAQAACDAKPKVVDGVLQLSDGDVARCVFVNASTSQAGSGLYSTTPVTDCLNSLSGVASVAMLVAAAVEQGTVDSLGQTQRRIDAGVKPDFVLGEFSTYQGFGFAVDGAISRDGQTYASIGIGIGGKGGALMGGWLVSYLRPTPRQVNNLLVGWAFNCSAGLLMFAGVSRNSSGFARMGGVGVAPKIQPAVGAACSFGWMWKRGRIPPVAWS